MKTTAHIVSAVLLGLTQACAHVTSMSVTPMPLERGTEVNAHEQSKLLFAGIGLDDDFGSDLTRQLRQECPDGRVEGILTRQRTTQYVFLVREEVDASGWCVQ
jgi:hypothetical protein